MNQYMSEPRAGPGPSLPVPTGRALWTSPTNENTIPQRNGSVTVQGMPAVFEDKVANVITENSDASGPPIAAIIAGIRGTAPSGQALPR